MLLFEAFANNEDVNVTVFNPTVVYAYDGFCNVDVEPSPKFHSHAVGGPPVEVSVNDTDA